MPGTSFHSTTRLADSARARSVADSPYRLVDVVTLPSGAADEAGDNGDNARLQRGAALARAPRGVGQTRRCAAVMIVHVDHLERVDVDGAAARSRIAAVRDLRGDTLAARPAGRSHVVRE